VLRRPASIPPRFVSFAWRYRGCARSFAPTGLRTPSACGPGLLGHPGSCRDLTAEITGFSQVPGRALLCTCPGLIPRGTLDARPLRRRGCCLPFTPRRRLPEQLASRGCLPRPAHSLSTLRHAGYPDATQDSLPVGGHPLPGRIHTYWARFEGFQFLSIAFSFLPSQIYPGARSVSSPGQIKRARMSSNSPGP
jgi:hypothetical protein